MRAIFLTAVAAIALIGAAAPVARAPAMPTSLPEFERTVPPDGIDEAYTVRPTGTLAADGSVFYRLASEENGVERFMLVGRKPTALDRVAALIRFRS